MKTGKKLSKSQRAAFARVCYFAFHTVMNVGTGIKQDQWFMQALTQTEKEELAKLLSLTHKLADRWRSFAWKLEGRN
jgi:hypothetical protein